jgi:WD40 repeat protein
MPIETIALSHDGLLLFTSDGINTLHIYSIPSQKLLQIVETPHDNMMALAVSPNNQNLVTSGHEGILLLWKIERDQFSTFESIKPRKTETAAHETNISAILITDNQKYLCTADEKGTVKIWEFPSLGKKKFSTQNRS